MEAQARTHQLLVHNRELLDHIAALVVHLQEGEKSSGHSQLLPHVAMPQVNYISFVFVLCFYFIFTLLACYIFSSALFVLLMYRIHDVFRSSTTHFTCAWLQKYVQYCCVYEANNQLMFLIYAGLSKIDGL